MKNVWNKKKVVLPPPKAMQNHQATINMLFLCLLWHGEKEKARCKNISAPGARETVTQGMVGTVCVECLEEEKQEQVRASTVARMMNSPAYQIELEDMINAN